MITQYVFHKVFGKELKYISNIRILSLYIEKLISFPPCGKENAGVKDDYEPDHSPHTHTHNHSIHKTSFNVRVTSYIKAVNFNLHNS